MRALGHELGPAFEDDHLVVVRKVDGQPGIALQIADPLGLRRAAEAQRAVDPHPVDRSDVGAPADPTVAIQ